jgi:hypothetical protein
MRGKLRVVAGGAVAAASFWPATRVAGATSRSTCVRPSAATRCCGSGPTQTASAP